MGGASEGVGSVGGLGAGVDGEGDAGVVELSGTSAGSNGCWSAACRRRQVTLEKKVGIGHT